MKAAEVFEAGVRVELFTQILHYKFPVFLRLLETLGDKLLPLLDDFSGETIVVPKIEELHEWAQKVSLYNELKKTASYQKLRLLASDYGIPYPQALRDTIEVGELLKEIKDVRRTDPEPGTIT